MNNETPTEFQVKKIEWHSVAREYYAVIDEQVLAQVYPDLSEEEVAELFQALLDGTQDIESVVEDDWGNGYIEFEHDYDDWWTDRKGGYEITYEVIE